MQKFLLIQLAVVAAIAAMFYFHEWLGGLCITIYACAIIVYIQKTKPIKTIQVDEYIEQINTSAIPLPTQVQVLPEIQDNTWDYKNADILLTNLPDGLDIQGIDENIHGCE